MSKNLPDWWVRISGTLGIFIALGGLALSYFVYGWQRQIYAESREERVFVQLNAEYTFLGSDIPGKTKPSQAQLTVEVVNLGMQPMYLKSVTGQVAGHQVFFYDHDLLDVKEPMRRLEPGEAADYTTDWESSLESTDATGGERSNDPLESPRATGVVLVETTKKWFSQPVRPRLNRVTISGDVAELPLRKKPRPILPRPKITDGPGQL